MTTSVKGLRELDLKLAKLGAQLGKKALRSATLLATTPALKAMKAAAPRGKRPHRTYKGRLVAPGFLSRSIVRRSSYRNGRARVIIGVKAEAFYGLQFVEKGTKPHVIPQQRRGRRGGAWRKSALAFGGRVVSRVTHPGAKPHPWFERTFAQQRDKTINTFSRQLRRKIERLSQ